VTLVAVVALLLLPLLPAATAAFARACAGKPLNGTSAGQQPNLPFNSGPDA